MDLKPRFFVFFFAPNAHMTIFVKRGGRGREEGKASNVIRHKHKYFEKKGNFLLERLQKAESPLKVFELSDEKLFSSKNRM